MILRGRLATGPEETTRGEIEIPGGPNTLDLRGHLVLPGLINAHDHLEFNLYPRLGRGPYPNAGDWARDIHDPGSEAIQAQRRIPKSTRLLWGALKNLLSGVTTVCHHNPTGAAIFDRNFPVRVVKRFGWAHSLEFSPDLEECFRETPSAWPFVVHLGEGTDTQAHDEFFRLDKKGMLDCRTVLVHAVALDDEGVALVKSKGASIVWCPSSNLFLFGRTLSPAILGSGIPIALGSDSALTADGDLLDELRVAHACGVAPDELYRMVTENAARILRLPRRPTDLAVYRDTGTTPAETLLFGPGPEMVILGGRIKLISPSMAQRLNLPLTRLSLLSVEGKNPVLVDADVHRLYQHVRRVSGDVYLAGRRVRPG